MNSFLTNAKSVWDTWADIAVFIAAAIALFLVSPPSLWPEAGSDTTLQFSRFTMIFVVGAFAVVERSRLVRMRPLWWLIIAIILLVIGAWLYFQYSNLGYVWTCPYLDSRMVIGAEYSPEGAALIASHPGFTCKEAIESAIGRTNLLWNADEILQRHTHLGLLFLGASTTIAMAILSLVKASK
jgi:hypothetical protein